MTTTNYRTQGVCARSITIETDGDVITNVEFQGGCDGNLKAIGLLVKGQKTADVAALLEGNTCGRKDTSCADQLAQALKTIPS